MAPEVVPTLFAGAATGVAAGFASAALVLVVVVRSPQWQARLADARFSLPIAGVILVNGLTLLWSLAGLLLGAAYHRAESRHPANGLLSPNWLFTLLVAGAVAALLIAVWVIRGRATAPSWLTAGVALIAFGWGLPLLAASA